MSLDEPSWCILMIHHDASPWWIVMMHRDDSSSWIVMIHHDELSWWMMLIHHDDSPWCIMMTQHELHCCCGGGVPPQRTKLCCYCCCGGGWYPERKNLTETLPYMVEFPSQPPHTMVPLSLMRTFSQTHALHIGANRRDFRIWGFSLKITVLRAIPTI